MKNLTRLKHILFFLFFVLVGSQHSLAQSWTKRMVFSQKDESIGVIEASNNELISVSNSYDGVSQYNIVVTRLPANGGVSGTSSTIIWQKQFNFSTYQQAISFIVDRSGNIVIVGSCVIGSNNRGFILKMDGNGGSVVSKGTDAGFVGCRLLRIIQMNQYGTNNSNDYVVLGSVSGYYTKAHYVARFNSSLGLVWANHYDIVPACSSCTPPILEYNELIYALAQAGNGEIVLGGGANQTKGYKPIIIRIDGGTTFGGTLISNQYFHEDEVSSQSIDNAVAIPNTNMVAFLTGRNINSSQNYGIIIYDVANQKIVKNLDHVPQSGVDKKNLCSRGGTIQYVKNGTDEELLIGVYLGTLINQWTDWIVATIDYKDLSVRKTYAFGNLNRNLGNIFISGNSTAQYLASKTDVIIGTQATNYATSMPEVVISKLSLSNNSTCFDEVESVATDFQYAGPTTLSMSTTSSSIVNLTCTTANVDGTINKICESEGCNVSGFCGNIGFETVIGEYPEWTGYMGNACLDKTYGSNFCHSFYKVDFNDPNTDPITTTNPTINTNLGDRIKKQTGGNDPTVGSVLPVLCPGGGTYSIRLENLSANPLKKEASKIVKTMVVPLTNPGMYIYKYALVMEDVKEHRENIEKPFFRVRVLVVNDGNCEKIGEMKCAKNIIYPNASFPDLKFTHLVNTNYYYKSWASVAIPLKEYAGKTIKIEFIVSDCADGGHLGYAYLDGACLNDQPTNTACDINGEMELIAPVGFETYWWSGPGIVGENFTKKIKINEGGLYTLHAYTETMCKLDYELDLEDCEKPVIPDCSISSLSAIPTSCNPSSNYYNLSGTLNFTSPPANGVLIISDGFLSQVYYAPFTTTFNYYISHIMTDGKAHTVTAKFYTNNFISSEFLSCQFSQNYTSPNPCYVPVIADYCENCLTSFNPEPGKYIISAWVKEMGANPDIETYTNPFIQIQFSTGAPLLVNASGKIIDKWQRIFYEFNIPLGATTISINLGTNSGSTLFDDIRIHPANGSFVSYVYDPVSLKLVATLDDNNYATIYEYDNEGTLLRVKKETERGIMTIKESRENSPKH